MDPQPSTSFDFKYDPYLENIKDEKPETQEAEEEIKIFKCSICLLEEQYGYKGQNPPFSRHVKMLEDSYIMEDPYFPPGKNEFIILGADCFICNNSVCKSPECSFFYLKTYCMNCLKENISYFPEIVQLKVSKIIKSK